MRNTVAAAHLDREERSLCISRMLLKEACKQLKVACTQIMCVKFACYTRSMRQKHILPRNGMELTAIEKHLYALWHHVDTSLNGLEALLIGDRLWRPAKSAYKLLE